MAEKRIRRTFSAEFKAKAVRAVLREDRTLAQVASEMGVHANQLTRWKTTVLEKLPGLFTDESQQAVAEAHRQHEEEVERLYAEIGRLTTQLAWVKKKAGLDHPG